MKKKSTNIKRLSPSEYNGVQEITEEYLRQVESERVPSKKGDSNFISHKSTKKKKDV